MQLEVFVLHNNCHPEELNKKFGHCEMNYRKLIKQRLVSSVRAALNYFQDY